MHVFRTIGIRRDSIRMSSVHRSHVQCSPFTGPVFTVQIALIRYLPLWVREGNFWHFMDGVTGAISINRATGPNAELVC